MRKRNHPLTLEWLVLLLEHPIEEELYFLVNPQSP